MQSPKARKFGARGALLVAGLAVLALAVVALLSPVFAVLCLGTVSALAGVVTHRRLMALAQSHEKLSSEIDIISQHVLKIQALAQAAAERVRAISAAPESGPSSAVTVVPADTRALENSIEEVATEIGLLGGMVRELATVVSTQESDLGTLKESLRATERRVGQVEQTARAAVARAGVVEKAAAQPTPVAAPAILPAPAPKPAETERDAALIDAFDGDGLEVWLQPVVTLPQRKVVSYEALARMRLISRDGAETILAPESFMPLLERHGRTTALDRRMLKGVVTIARHLWGRGSTATVGYALSPLSLYEPGFLRSLAGLVGDGTDLSGKLLVSLPQASWRNLDGEQQAVLSELSGRIGFILDRPTDLRFEPSLLAERGITLVKVPASYLLRPDSKGVRSDIAVEDLVTALGRAGVRLVASDVEKENEVPDLIDLDVPLAQGIVFATPRAVRAEVFGPSVSTPVEAGPSEQEPEPEPEPPPQRRAFRDFLRRAV